MVDTALRSASWLQRALHSCVLCARFEQHSARASDAQKAGAQLWGTGGAPSGVQVGAAVLSTMAEAPVDGRKEMPRSRTRIALRCTLDGAVLLCALVVAGTALFMNTMI